MRRDTYERLDDSKLIALPLMKLGKPDVLIIGGIFAVMSYFINVGPTYVLPDKICSISTSIAIIGVT